MLIKYTNEGDLVADLIYCRGDNPQETAPEASMLPHLGAKHCHGFCIEDLLGITHDPAKPPGNAPPFTTLWVATERDGAQREELAGRLSDFDVVTTGYENDTVLAFDIRD